MYNAQATYHLSDNQGSTRLHQDMTDAVNVMMYAGSTPAGAQGYAVWDIFKAEDSKIVRSFVQSYHATEEDEDPIHSQQRYLDHDALEALFQQHGIKAHRIYQTSGQAVFIPAGCAHQVRLYHLYSWRHTSDRTQVANAADSIKIAMDFVSIENLLRSEALTREFRDVNLLGSEAWKEDILQLRMMMWFAWLSSSQQY
jgi:lysine-specific demethylase 3